MGYSTQNTRILAREIDAESLIEIDRQSYRYGWDIDTFKQVLESKFTYGIVCEQDTDTTLIRVAPLLVGYMVYRLTDKAAYVISMGTLMDARRLGVGTCMITYLKRAAEEVGAKKIVARISEDNTGAQLFYKNNGFKATATLSPYRSRDTIPEGRLYQMEFLV